MVFCTEPVCPQGDVVERVPFLDAAWRPEAFVHLDDHVGSRPEPYQHTRTYNDMPVPLWHLPNFLLVFWRGEQRVRACFPEYITFIRSPATYSAEIHGTTPLQAVSASRCQLYDEDSSSASAVSCARRCLCFSLDRQPRPGLSPVTKIRAYARGRSCRLWSTLRSITRIWLPPVACCTGSTPASTTSLSRTPPRACCAFGRNG